MRVAKDTGLLVIVGTSGATNLPNQTVAQTLKYGGTILDVNLDENNFSQIALKKKNGYDIQGNSSGVLPQLQLAIRQLIEKGE